MVEDPENSNLFNYGVGENTDVFEEYRSQ